MNIRKGRIIGLILILVSVLIIILSMYQKSIIILFVGIFTLVVSVFLSILLPYLYVFKEDRILNEEKIIEQGLHIVLCKSCERKNVLEDKYCIYCGEDLAEEDENV